MNLTHLQIKVVDMDFMDPVKVQYFIVALLYFVHEWLNINLKVVSITGLRWKFHQLDCSFILVLSKNYTSKVNNKKEPKFLKIIQ